VEKIGFFTKGEGEALKKCFGKKRVEGYSGME